MDKEVLRKHTKTKKINKQEISNILGYDKNKDVFIGKYSFFY
jgi:hypothetical protein